MPGYDEIADIDVINGNMDKIDVQMKKNADSAQQSKDIVSDEYSATNTYAVGDYCIHENVLYKCKTAITTGEEFDSNKWVQTTCGTEFGELNSNLTDLAFGENSGSANIFNGKIVGGLLIETGEISGLAQTRITSDFIPVEPNTLYTQIAPTSAKGGRYCEYDANKNLVYFYTNGLQDTLTTKPTTKYLRISFGSEYGTTFKNDIAIIKGNATEYVPYIMSNKQLGALNESLADYGLNNKATPLKQGGYTAEDGTYENVGYWVCTSEMIPCKKGDTITIKSQYGKTHTFIMVRYYNASKQFIGTTWNENSNTYTTTCSFDNVAYCNVNFQKDYDGQGITPSEVVVSVYVNNAIEKLKNDLGGLSLSVSGTTLSITDGTNTWTLSN